MSAVTEVKSPLSTITIRPVNHAAASKGSIHDDEKAREMGYRGGLVSGSTVLAYMSRLMHETYGPAWVESGTFTGRLRRPVYEGGDVTVEGEVVEAPSAANNGRVTVELRVRTPEGDVAAVGQASCRA